MRKRVWSILLAGLISCSTLQAGGIEAAAEARASGYSLTYEIQASGIGNDGNRYGKASVSNWGDTAGDKNYWQILALAAYSNENELNNRFWDYAASSLSYGSTAPDAIQRAFEKGDFTYADKLDNYVNRWSYGERYNTAGYSTGHHDRGWHDALIMIPQLGMKYDYAFLMTSGKNGKSASGWYGGNDYNYTGVCFVPGYAYDFVAPNEEKSYGTLYWFPARVNDGNYRYWGAGKNTNMWKYSHMTDYKTNSSFSNTFQVFKLSDELYNMKDATGIQLSTRYVSNGTSGDAGARINLEEGYLSRRVCRPNLYLYTADGGSMENAEYAALLNSIRPQIQLVKGKSGGDGSNGLYVGSTLNFTFQDAVYQPVILKASGSSQWGWNRNSSGLSTGNATLEIIPEATGGAKASDISVYMVFERRQTVQLDERLAAALAEKQVTYTVAESPTDYRQQAKDYSFSSKAGSWTLSDFRGNAVNVTNLRTINFNLPGWELRLEGQTYAGDADITIPASLYHTKNLKFEVISAPAGEQPKPVETAPQVKTGLIYNGEEQQGVTEGTGYILRDYKATDAGSYTATVELEEGYAWADGSTEAKQLIWSIGKAYQSAPEGVTGQEPSAEGESDGQLTGTTETMEYAAAPLFGDAKSCTEGHTEGLAAGVYYVRYKEDANHHAGAPAIIQIGEGGSPVVFHPLEVKRGSGSGSYPEGMTVHATAHAPGEGYVFSGWSGTEGLTFLSGSASDIEISFSMPEGGATIEATYTAVVTWTATVENGTGGGSYLPGTRVTITANPSTEPGQVFDKWEVTEGTVTLVSATDATTSFEMPGENVTVKAVYRHEHSYVWIMDQEATETEKGWKHEECSTCGDQKERVEIPATGNEPDKPEPDKPDPDKPNPDNPNPDKPNPDKPKQDKPSGGSGGGSGHGGSSKGQTAAVTAAQKTVSAKTGDEAPAELWGLMGGSAALLILALWRRRKIYNR